MKVKQYTDIAVSANPSNLDIQRSMFLDITIGSTDVLIRLLKEPSTHPTAESEKGDWLTLSATRRYQLKSHKHAFAAIEYKTATGTSTFTLYAMNDELIIVQPYPSA